MTDWCLQTGYLPKILLPVRQVVQLQQLSVQPEALLQQEERLKQQLLMHPSAAQMKLQGLRQLELQVKEQLLGPKLGLQELQGRPIAS